MKRVLAIFMAVIMLLSSAPLSGFVGLELPKLTASASTTGTHGDLIYSEYDTYVVIAECEFYVTSVTIPSSINSKPVISIGYGAFKSCKYLLSITIPDSVTSIGGGAFYGCSSLEEVHISSIEAWLNIDFMDHYNNPLCYGARLYLNNELVENLVIPNDITEIKNYVFSGCSSFKSITIPDSVTSIGEYAFENCISLKSITIPDSVTSIGICAFEDCSSLKSITIPESVISISVGAFEGCNSLEEMTLPFVGASRTAIGEDSVFGYIFSYSYDSSSGGIYQYNEDSLYRYYHIPTSLRKVTITDANNIPKRAFYNCSMLTDITIPDSVTIIGDEAFYNTIYYNDEANWENGVLYIGNYLIKANTSISSDYTIMNGIRCIASGAFEGCSLLESISIPDSAISIGYRSFYGCSSLKSVTIPDSVKIIGADAFRDCRLLQSIIIPDSLIIIVSSAFFNTAYYNNAYNWENGVLYIGNHLIAALQFISGDYTIKNGTKTIAYDAFDCCSLESITIPDSVTSIGGGAFWGCSSLQSITIPDSVTSIGGGAFWGCSSLQSITIPDSVKSIGESAFRDCRSLQSITIPDSVKIIGDDAFSGCSSLESITIPDSVKSIGWSAFEECTSLESITIPGSVTSIGYSAFWDCSSLKSVTIPDSVTVIEDSAFEGCTSLQSITIPDSVKVIEDSAFKGCTSLQSVTIPNSVKRIENNVFSGCTSLQNIIIPDSVTVIEYSAFEGCNSLQNITIPDSVTVIGYGAFESCSSLEEITLSLNGFNNIYRLFNNSYSLTDTSTLNSLKRIIISECIRIYSNTFKGCRSLESITIPASVISINNDAFDDCSSLTTINVNEKNKHYSSIDGVLFNKDKTSLVRYPAGKLEKSYTIPESVTNIGGYAFSNCSSLKSITIPDDLIVDSGYTFSLWKSLTNIDVKRSNEKYTSIDGVLFTIDGTSLVRYPAGKSEKSYTIPDSVTSIGNGAFSGCESLQSITIPNSVTSFGSHAFIDCSSLESIRIPNSVESIGYGAFEGCISLQSITIPDSVKSIGDYAFSGCKNLESITIPNSVKSIGQHAFYNCNSLQYIYYEGTEEQWNENKPGRDFPHEKMQFLYLDGNKTGESEGTKIITGGNSDNCSDRINITVYSQDADSIISSGLNGSQVTCGDFLYEINTNERTASIEKAKANGPITIIESNHRNYIIPEAVVTSFKNNNQTVEFSAYLTWKSDKDYYISSVFGKKGDDTQYVDLKQSEIECREGENASIIVTACGLKNPTYYISQDNSHKISNTTGIFNAVDVYNNFNFDGDIVAYAIDCDGNVTDPVIIKLSKKIELSNSAKALSEMTTMNLLGSNGMGFEISEDFPIIGGSNIDFSAFKIPMGISIKGNAVRISLGFDFFENEKNYETGEWKSFKNNCKGIEETLDEYDETYDKWKENWYSLENLKKQYSGKNIIKTGPANKNMGWDCSFLGYLEATITDVGELSFKEGSLLASAEFNFKYTQQTAVWAIPAYYYFELGAKASIEGLIQRLVPDRTCPIDWAVTLAVEPKVAIGGGAGIVDFASVGLRGEGSLPIKMEFVKGHLTIDLNGALYAEGQLLFIKGKKKIIDGTLNILDKNLWNTGKSKMPPPRLLKQPNLEIEQEDTVVSVMSRDYNKNTSPWLGSAAPIKLGGIQFTNLQKRVYNQSQPQVVTVGNKQVMVYVADNKSRDDYNRLCLMYSVYENGVWSQPKSVYDDGMNDATPSLATDGENVFVAWQKVAKKLTEEDCTSEDALLKNMEIYVAQFNGETSSFEGAKRITENSIYSYNPFAVVENGKATVYYSEGDPKTNTNKICSYSDGTITTHKTDLPLVIAIRATANEVSYLINENTSSASNDIAIYTIRNTGETKKYDFGKNAASCRLLTYGELDGKQTLFVSDGAYIYYLKNDHLEKAFSNISSVYDCLQAVKTDDGLTLIWIGYSQDSTDIYTCSYTNGVWGEPVQISQQGNIISFLSANYINGTIQGVCNVTENSYNEETKRDEIQTNLVSFSIGDFSDLSISLYAPREEKIVPGETIMLNSYVTQHGTQDVSMVQITIEDTLGTDTTFNMDVDIKSGSTVNLEIPYQVPDNYKGVTITAKIEPVLMDTDYSSNPVPNKVKSASLPTNKIANIVDMNESNNMATVKTGKTTIIINDNPIEEFDNMYVLPLKVENNTALEYSGLKLKYSLENYNEEIENESVTIDLDDFAANSYNSVRIAVKKDALIYNENGLARLNVSVLEGNNIVSSHIATIEKTETVCLHPLTQELAEKPATCAETGLTKGEKCSVCDEVITAQQTINKLEHAYTVLVNTVPSTCVALGHKVMKCENCDTTTNVALTEYVAHTWNEGKITTPATCAHTGVKTFTCTACNETKTDTIAKDTNHKNIVTVSGTPATCTQAGLTNGKICETCNTIIEEQKTINKLDHSYTVLKDTVPSTCIELGHKVMKCANCEATTNVALAEYGEHTPGAPATETTPQTCTVCGYVIKPALGHTCTPVTIPGTPATCTEKGLTEGIKCSDCGTIIKAQTEIPALEHKEEIIPGKAATCTEKGLTDGKKCSVCGEITLKQVETPTISHEYTEVVTKPTCTEGGFTTRTCENCGHVEKVNETPVIDHTPSDWIVETAAKVGVKGLEIKKCTSCGVKLEEREIPALKEEPTTEAPTTEAPTTEAPTTEAPTTEEPTTEPSYMLGDINGDNKVTATDARIILRISARLEKLENQKVTIFAAADVNGDGKITSVDARKVLRVATRLDKFEA